MSYKNKVSLLLYLLTLLIFNQISAAAVVRIDGTEGRINLQHSVEWLVDKTGQMGLDDLATNSHYFSKPVKNTSYPRSDNPYWFRINLLSDETNNSHWLLELAYTQLDHLDFYSRTEGEPWRHVSTGDSHLVSSRDVRHPNPLFNVSLQPGKVTEILLRVQSSTSILVPLTLWQDQTLASYNQDNLLIKGICYGVLLALIFYNLILYPTMRDSLYPWFALYLTGFVLFQFSHDGFSALYLWPDQPVLADRAVTISLWVCMGAGLRFTQLVGQTQQFSPRLNRFFNGLSLLCFLLAITVALFGPATVFPLLPLIAILILALIPWSLWIASLGGCRSARFALLAFFPQLPGVLLLVARTLNWVQPSFWSEHSFIIGGAVSSILLSFALADRINSMREKHAKAQRGFSQQLIEVQDNERKRIAVELHDGVGQNLSFLVNAFKRLHRQDGCTLPESIDEAAQNAVDEVRSISHRLHPHLLDKLGLVAAIEAIAERTMEQTGIQCLASMEEVDRLLPNGAGLHLYRIAQESLNNAVKHSQASQILLSLRQRGQRIELIVEDNGRGLKDDAMTATGLGFDSIIERISLLDGYVDIENVKPHGLKLTISIPAGATTE